MVEDRTAVLIIRAWVEPHPSSPLRVTIHGTTHLSTGFESTLNLADADAVTQFVDAWLRDAEANAQPPAPE